MMNKISLTGGIASKNRKELTMTRISMWITALFAAFLVFGCAMDDAEIPEPGGAAAGAGTQDEAHDRDGDNFIDKKDGGTDCNDRNEDINPDAKEVCDNNKDDDCDGKIDAADPDCKRTDADGDGFVDDREVGGDDCDDTDPYVHPGAKEICDGKDNDCNASTPADVGCDNDIDNDSYAAEGAGGDDCNDFNDAVHPGAPEICGNDVDDNCDGLKDKEDPSCRNDGPTNKCVPGTAKQCECPAGYDSLQYCTADGMSYDDCICTGGGNTGGAPATGGMPATGGTSNVGGTGGAPSTGGTSNVGGTGGVVETDLVAVTFIAFLPDSRTADGVKVEGLVDVIRNGESRIEWLNICDSGLTQTGVTDSYSCTVYFPRNLWTEREYNFRAEYPNLSCVYSDDYLTGDCPPIEVIYFVGESHGEVVFRGDFLIEVDGVAYNMRDEACVVPNGLDFVGGYNVKPNQCI